MRFYGPRTKLGYRHHFRTIERSGAGADEAISRERPGRSSFTLGGV